MISQRLVQLIEKNEAELARICSKDVRENEFTISYHKLSEDKLAERVKDLFRHLNRWLSGDRDAHRMEEIYTQLGADRFREGFHISEIIQAFILVRRAIAAYAMDQRFLDTATELIEVMDLTRTANSFFDHAILFTTRGYEKEAALFPPSR